MFGGPRFTTGAVNSNHGYYFPKSFIFWGVLWVDVCKYRYVFGYFSIFGTLVIAYVI